MYNTSYLAITTLNEGFRICEEEGVEAGRLFCFCSCNLVVLRLICSLLLAIAVVSLSVKNYNESYKIERFICYKISKAVYLVTIGRTIGTSYPRMVSNSDSKHLLQNKVERRSPYKEGNRKGNQTFTLLSSYILFLFILHSSCT